MSFSLLPSRLRSAIDRYGAAGLVRQLALRARNFAYMDESHVWYVLDTADIPELPLAEGYRLALATDADQDKIDGFSTVALKDAHLRRAAGNQLWFALHGDELAFSCWIFLEATPVRAAADRV